MSAVLDGIFDGLLIAVIIWGTVGIALLLHQVFEGMRERWGRVPVIDPTWWKIHDGIERALRLPGRVLRWARPRDTPHGLGGP